MGTMGQCEKSHKDILSIESIKVTLHFGYTYKFLDRCAKSQQRAKNGNFQNLFFKLSTHNCRYSHETCAMIDLDAPKPQ